MISSGRFVSSTRFKLAALLSERLERFVPESKVFGYLLPAWNDLQDEERLNELAKQALVDLRQEAESVDPSLSRFVVSGAEKREFTAELQAQRHARVVIALDDSALGPLIVASFPETRFEVFEGYSGRHSSALERAGLFLQRMEESGVLGTDQIAQRLEPLARRRRSSPRRD